jgi:hypothetical protein
MAKWMDTFIETFKGEEGREPTKKELYLATPLVVISTTNEKKKGSASFDRFQGYFEGPESIEEAFANGLRQDDIRHDSERGFIVLGDRALEILKEREEPTLL